MLIYCLKRHARLAVLELCHKSPALVLALQHLALCLEVGIERRKILPEVIYAALEELVGHEEMLLHIVLFYLISCLTREDDKLSHHVLTAQVDARVRLAITLLLGSQYSLGEWHICRNLIEDKIERSTQNCLNLKYFITRVLQVVDSADDRQTGTYVCLKQEFHATLESRLLEFEITLVVARRSHLVGSHNRDIVVEEFLIKSGHLTACCAIHKHTIEDVHADNFLAQMINVAWSRLGEFFAIVAEVDAFAAEYGVVTA